MRIALSGIAPWRRVARSTGIAGLPALLAFVACFGGAAGPAEAKPPPGVTPGNPPAQGVYREAGPFLFSSGVGARRADGTVPAGMAAQSRAILEKLQNGLAARGLSLADVVKVTIYLTDMRLKAEMNAEYNKVFAGLPPPARVTVGVAALDPDLLVEMDLIAVKK